MPDDRFLHRRLGHSDKVTTLSDFQFRVWVQYILSSDDFGIMRFTAATLQADSDALASRGHKLVQRALEHLAVIGLIRTFQHQSRTYCYQHDWQDWQKVRYPSKTIHPLPPAGDITQCSRHTRWLFAHHPGGDMKLPSWKAPKDWDGGESMGEFPENSGDDSGDDSASHARPLAVSLSPLAVSRSPTHPRAIQGSGVMAGTLPRDHVRHAWCSERICVPDFLHGRFVSAVGGDCADVQLRAFYGETVRNLSPSQPIENDPLKFWPPRVSARWPPEDAQVGTRTAALQRATAEFVRGVK